MHVIDGFKIMLFAKMLHVWGNKMKNLRSSVGIASRIPWNQASLAYNNKCIKFMLLMLFSMFQIAHKFSTRSGIAGILLTN